MIRIDNVYYSYKSASGTISALSGVSLSIAENEITAIIGRTGSGKSTLLEIMGGITKPDSGSITPALSPYSCGIVFQYPEQQLFAETVYNDIAFGPSCRGLKGEALDRCVKESAALAGLSEDILNMPPFFLSGGQKRLAAIAGVLANKPSLLLLDEPAAGLDPTGRKLIFSIMKSLCRNGITVVFVTHSMEDAAENADSIVILKDGKNMAQGAPDIIFSDLRLLSQCSLAAPAAMKIKEELSKRGIDCNNMITVADAVSEISKILDKYSISPDHTKSGKNTGCQGENNA